MGDVLRVLTKDHPEANGRIPQRGDVEYGFTFPLEDGCTLEVRMGQETLDKFREFLGSMDLDDATEPLTNPSSA